MNYRVRNCALDWWSDDDLLAYRKDLKSGPSVMVSRTSAGFEVEGIDHVYDNLDDAIDVAVEFVEALDERWKPRDRRENNSTR